MGRVLGFLTKISGFSPKCKVGRIDDQVNVKDMGAQDTGSKGQDRNLRPLKREGGGPKVKVVLFFPTVKVPLRHRRCRDLTGSPGAGPEGW